MTESEQPSRPTQHGGGEAGPPIAGDTASFPSDAELSRTLVAQTSTATLCTLTSDGFPYGSAVSYSVDDDGAPVVLVSEMAEHTVNMRGDNRTSFLIARDVPTEGDPLGQARLTVVGRMNVVDDPGPVRERYLESHPYARYYVDFTDFGFWRLSVERLRFVGGFGHMSWLTAETYTAAEVDPVADAAPDAVDHMNADHQDANLLYVQKLAGLPEATEASVLSIDRYGITLKAETPNNQRMARVAFPSPLTKSDQLRPAVVDLVQKARQA